LESAASCVRTAAVDAAPPTAAAPAPAADFALFAACPALLANESAAVPAL
jgi:hypothetical protein